MSKEKSSSLQVLILDADRNPIKKLAYRLYFKGAMISAETGEDGMTRKILSLSPDDEVQIAIERMDKSLKIVARVVAGVGTKLVTLVSPRVKVVSPALPHTGTSPGQVPSIKESTPPIYGADKTKLPIDKKEFGPKVDLLKDKDGNSISKVEGDIPNFEFLDEFNGEEMRDEDYLWAAKVLGIESAIIKAFAIVEAGGEGFFELAGKMVPKILYERHRFAKFTANAYSKLNPDISLPCGYYNKKDRYILADTLYKKRKKIPEDIEYYRAVGKKDDEETKKQAVSFHDLVKEGKVDRRDHAYYDGEGSYKRLIKAYKLDSEAALKSCSWGSFQIMGEYWQAMGYSSVIDFTKSVSRSPREQIKAFVLYANKVSPAIKKLLNSKDWAAIACAYNGPNYKANEYDVKLQKEYEKAKKEKI
jgi:hypothetical protein